jgi:L-arabinonolactonase
MLYEVEHVLCINNVVGEGPIWNPTEQALLWVDIGAGRFFKFIPATGDFQSHALDQPIGCLALHADGGLVLAVSAGIAYWDNGPLVICKSRDQLGTYNRFNDGAVDRAGRFWVGTASDKPENHLFRLDCDGTAYVMETGIIISNGIGWSPDNQTMYYSDSGGSGVVYAYDFDLESGSISHRRVFLPPTGTAAVADGLTVDSEGCLWIAFWDGWRVERRAPDGSLLQQIAMPVQRPTSCAFGGKELNELYVTSASPEIVRTEQPQAGDLFKICTDVKGLPEPTCKLVVEG